MSSEPEMSIRDMVVAAFGYLEKECGFTPLYVGATGAEYQKGDVHVSVVHRFGWTAVSVGRLEQRNFPLDWVADVHPEFPRVESELGRRPPAEVGAFLRRVAAEARPLLCALDSLPPATFEALRKRAHEENESRVAEERAKEERNLAIRKARQDRRGRESES